MATTSYGSITIVDITDIGEFSVYPKANGSRTQIYNPDASSYTPNWDTSVSGGVAMVISPVAYYAGQNVTSSASYTWKRRVGVTESDVSAANGENVSSGVLTISKNVLANIQAGLITYVLYATYTVDGTTLNAIGEIDFSLVKQGSTAKVAKIIGENVFKYNTSGALVPTGHTITLEGTVNNVSISGWKYYNPESASADAEGYVTYPNSTTAATLTVSPTDNVFINDVAKIKLVTTDNNTYDIFTISKLRDGAAGTSTVSAVLSNEDQMIPCDKNGNPISGAFASAVTTLTIYEGSTDVTSTWTISKRATNVTDDAVQNNQATISAISADTGKVVFTCTKTGKPTFTKEFTLIKIKAGADGTTPTIYSLECDLAAVNMAEDGTFSPQTATFKAYYQIGNGTKTAYSGRIQFYVNGSNTATDLLNQNVTTRDFDFSTHAGTSRVQAVLYEAGANTNRLDAQTVVVTSDGVTGDTGPQGPQGVSAVSLIISNEADVIPCTSANHPIPNGTGTDSDKFIITIPFEGYQGLAKKNTNATTVPSLPAATWGTSQAIQATVVNATTTSAGSIIYKIPNTATVPENGTLSFTFTVQADGGNVLVNKIYSWTRSSAAVNGENAVILQLITPDGTVIENGSGTLYAQGILYDGASEATGETYTWYQYKSNNYVAIDNAATSSATPGVTTGHLSGTTWTAGANGSANTTSDMIKITPAAVDGYASFKVVCAYTAGGQSRSFIQYVSVIDKSDPIQVSVHSTIGTQIVNGQGAGALYARVTRDGEELDYVPMDIKAGTSYPSNPNNGDYFVLLSGSGTSGTATLKVYNGSSWNTVTSNCNYSWSYRDKDNNPVTTNIPATTGQFVYIDKTLIKKKITADVEVTVN